MNRTSRITPGTRAVHPAWFADQRLAPRSTPPLEASVTGVTVAARPRRDSYDWSSVVRGPQMPALLLRGDTDALDPAAARETANLLRTAASTTLPDAGRMPFREATAQFFAAVEFSPRAPTLPTTDG